MNKPIEHEYASHVAYTRALEEYTAELEAEREKWKSAKLEEFTNIWRVRCEDRDETIERQRCMLFDLREENTEIEAALRESKSALREAKSALETCGYADDSTDPEMCGPYLDFNAVVKALATINKVLGEE